MTDSPDVRAIPEDYGSVTPYVLVRGAAEFIEFLEAAFGAVERFRVNNGDGTIGHAEVSIGDSVIQMFDAPKRWPETPAFLTLYVEYCDTTHRSALDAGAITVTEISENAWGDRSSRVRDPFGNVWWIQSHIENVPEKEAARRMGEESYVEDMRVAVETLDRELTRRTGDRLRP